MTEDDVEHRLTRLETAVERLERATRRVTLDRTASAFTTDELLWAVIRDRTQAIAFTVLARDAGGNFEADPEILAEGAFLKAQLAGVRGTEAPQPLFKATLTLRPRDAVGALGVAGGWLLTMWALRRTIRWRR